MESTYQRLANLVRAELALYPGRLSLILRIACACTISMSIVMTFHIPGGALGAYYPLLLAHDNARTTLHAATRTAVVCCIGTAEIVLGAMLLMADPLTHLLWVLGNLLIVFFLISTLEAYDTALAFGLLVSNAIAIWDQPVSAEQRLTKTLFTLLSILIGCVVSVVIECVFARTHRRDAVVDGIRARLGVVAEAAMALANKEAVSPSARATLSRYTLRGTGDLRERLANAEYEPTYKDQLSAALALTGRLVELTTDLIASDSNLTNSDAVMCRSISGKIEWICTRLSHDEPPDWLSITEQDPSSLPILVEMERTVELIAESFNSDSEELFPLPHLPASGDKARKRIFVPDMFGNPEHFKFAVRGTLSAMACYLAYMSVGWTGLNAAIATCVLSALKNTGATRHKQLMRFSGMLFGACILGYFSQSVLLPQIDSIQSFALLFAAVIALGAWVGTSSPRLAHAGAQMVLAYNLVNLSSFGMNPSLVQARDAVLGILVGIAAMWLIYDHLWTRSTPESIRTLVLAGIHRVSALRIEESLESVREQEFHLWAECEELTRKFDRVRNLVDYSVFEVHRRLEDEIFIEWVKEAQPQLRALMMVKSGLLHHRVLAAEPAPDHIVEYVCERSRELLDASLLWLEGEVSEIPNANQQDDLMRVVQQQRIEAEANDRSEMVTEMRLCASLLYLSVEMRDRARHWYERTVEIQGSPQIIGDQYSRVNSTGPQPCEDTR